MTPTTPRTATLTAPLGTQEGHAGETLTLEWTQYLSSPQGHPPVEHFEICLYNPQLKNCSNTPLRWVRAPNEIPRVASGAAAHVYTFELPTPLSKSELDRPMEWQVGACATPAESSCAFATAHVWLSTKNLQARIWGLKFDWEYSTASWHVVAGAASLNFSSTPVAASRYETELLRAVATAQDTCETDVTSAYNAGLADTALTWRGEELNLATLPRRADGTIDVGNHYIVAVYARALPTTVLATAGGLETFLPDQPSENLVTTSSPYTAGAYAVRHSVDVDAAIVEYDETDNRWGFCEVPPPPNGLLTVEIDNPSAEVLVMSQPAGLACTMSSASNCSQSFQIGTLVTLRALGPFVGWSGCDAEHNGDCEVTVTFFGHHVVAEFEPANSQPSPQP